MRPSHSGRRSARARPGLLRIGEASRIAGISQRAFRHYDAMGLVKPDLIGKGGYRYYSHETVLKIPAINYLKRMGFSLEEIGSIFKSDDLSSIHTGFGERRAECVDEMRSIEERLRIIDAWSGLLEEATFVMNAGSLDVSTKFLPSKRLLCMPWHFNGRYDDATINLDFTAFVERLDNVIAGPVMMRRPLSGCMEDGAGADGDDVVILQEALREIPPEHEFIFPHGLYLSTYHVGDFREMGRAYRRLADFAEQRGRSLTGTHAIERYVTDYWTTADPSLFVTEILIPLETGDQVPGRWPLTDPIRDDERE